MSEEDWTIVSKSAAAANKWDDEEDDDVKDNWDDDSDNENSKASSNDAAQSEAPKPAVAAKKKKGKALKEKLAQKEMESQRPKTQEELLAEKLERQRLQEESDLNLAKDAFGAGGGSDVSVLSSIQLSSRDDFEVFRKALNGKFSNFTRSPYYVPFLEEFLREIAVGLETDDIKKLDTALMAVFNEKIKAQKAGKGKKGKKKEIKVERDDDFSYNQQSSNYDDFDDFI